MELLSVVWINLFFYSTFFILQHFVIERRQGIHRLSQAEEKLDSLHRKNFQGKKKWWVTFDRGNTHRPWAHKVNSKLKLSELEGETKHSVAIDFGE